MRKQQHKMRSAEQVSVVKVTVPLAMANLDGQFKRGQVGLSGNPLGQQFHGGQMTYTQISQSQMRVARIYLRVSTDEQDLTRQLSIEDSTRAAGYYVAGVYREKASGARADRPELLRMIADLQPGEVVVAEKIDRISRLPLAEAEQLVASIRTKGAKLAVPGVVDLSEFAAEADGVARIVLESVQELLMKLALQMARDDYETRRERQRQGIHLAQASGKYSGRAPDAAVHQRIIALRRAGQTIKHTAELAGCSVSQVKRIWAQHRGGACAEEKCR